MKYWVTIMLGFGFSALGLFISSVVSIRKRKHVPGLIFAILELVSAAASAFAWICALKSSGKVDWYLLGLSRYTPMALICYSMFLVGILCVLGSIRGFRNAESNWVHKR